MVEKFKLKLQQKLKCQIHKLNLKNTMQEKQNEEVEETLYLLLKEELEEILY